MRNGTPRGDREGRYRWMDAGSTGLGFYTHGHAALIWLKKQFLTLGKCVRMP